MSTKIENAIKKYFTGYYEREMTMIKSDFAYERTVRFARTIADEEKIRVEKTHCCLEDGTRIAIWFADYTGGTVYYDWRIVPSTWRIKSQ